MDPQAVTEVDDQIVEATAEIVEKDFMDAPEDCNEKDIHIVISDDSEPEEFSHEIAENDLVISDDEPIEDIKPHKTVHEVADDKIELILASQVLPNKLVENSPIKLLGHIYCATTPYALVIKSCPTSGDTPLDADSILTLEDRTVVGKVFETFGQVSCPYYLVRFPNPKAVAAAFGRWAQNTETLKVHNDEEINLDDDEEAETESNIPAQPELLEEEAIQLETPDKRFPPGTPIWYGVELSKIVPVAKIKNLKGSDASNFHDESASEAELEFSDDEKERDHKLQMNLNTMEGRQGAHRGRFRGRGRGQFGNRDRGRDNGGFRPPRDFENNYNHQPQSEPFSDELEYERSLMTYSDMV